VSNHTPSLSEVVDVLDCRIEYAESHGLADEQRALTAARETILDHVFRDYRNLTITAWILERVRRRWVA
jgi:hypothetical protein